MNIIFEPPHNKTNKIICAPSEDSNQPGYSPSLIKVFAVRSMGSKGPKVSSCGSDVSDQTTGRMPRLINLRWAQKNFLDAFHIFSVQIQRTTGE